MSGRFITLEGGEGAGKSTQARLLAEWLRGIGHDVVETREPGGTQAADAIRTLLMAPDVPLTPHAEAYLFAAARADHVERLIRPSLVAGKWIICDRFLDSSLAYQGAAGGLGVDHVRAINESAVGQTIPDLTIVLRTQAKLGIERAMARDGSKDRFGSRDLAFHEAVAAAFASLATAEPERFAVVDADGSIESVAGAIQAVVQERLL